MNADQGSSHAKAALRCSLKETLSLLSLTERHRLSGSICEGLAALAGNSNQIALYYPLPDEVDILGLAAQWHTAGRDLFLPVTLDRRRMVFRRWDPRQALRTGRFGVAEPPEGALEVLIESLDLMVVPGLAFDRQGYRLGRGAGYYDRLPSGIPPSRVGVCFSFQVVDALPIEPWDKKMNHVVTEFEHIRAQAPEDAGIAGR